MTRIKAACLAIAVLAVASGCGPSYRETLHQKLEGKTIPQKRVLLARECESEIRSGLIPGNAENVEHFETIKRICEEMTGEKIALGAKTDRAP
jgi:hypothetical protein